MTKRLITLGIAMLCSTIFTMAQDNKVTLHILETSDVHGAFFPIDFFNSKPLPGSMARVSTYVNRLRQQHGENVILQNVETDEGKQNIVINLDNISKAKLFG